VGVYFFRTGIGVRPWPTLLFPPLFLFFSSALPPVALPCGRPLPQKTEGRVSTDKRTSYPLLFSIFHPPFWIVFSVHPPFPILDTSKTPEISRSSGLVETPLGATFPLRALLFPLLVPPSSPPRLLQTLTVVNFMKLLLLLQHDTGKTEQPLPLNPSPFLLSFFPPTPDTSLLRRLSFPLLRGMGVPPSPLDPFPLASFLLHSPFLTLSLRFLIASPP